MHNKAIIYVTILFFAIVLCIFGVYRYWNHDSKYIIVLEPDQGIIKKKPEDPGGITIAHANSSVYEKLHRGVHRHKKPNIMPEPEIPMNNSTIESPLVDFDPIDQILANIDANQGGESESKLSAVENVIDNVIMTGHQARLIASDNAKQVTASIAYPQYNHQKINVSGVELEVFKSSKTRLHDYDYENQQSNMSNTKSNDQYQLRLLTAYSEAEALTQQQVMLKKYNKILGNANLITRKIMGVNDRIFYEVLAGTYRSANEANVVCKKLKLLKQDCIIVK